MNTSLTSGNWVAASTDLASKITVLSDGVDEFVSWVFEQERDDASIDHVYEWLDRDLKNGRVSRVNRVLRVVRQGYLDKCAERPAVALAFLTQTGFDRSKLDEWSVLKSALYSAISHRHSATRAERVLGHLPSA